jgi:hypothetical protein
LASLEGARAAVQRLKAQGPLTSRVDISIQQGTYTLLEPFVLSSVDSGTEEYSVQYVGNGKVIISGGRQIDGFEVNDEGLWVAQVTEVGDRSFDQLFVNGRRAIPAQAGDGHGFEAKAIGAEGEWVLAGNGTLYYKPLPSENIEDAHVVAPALDEFVRFEGDPAAEQWVQNIALRGLTFHYSRGTRPAAITADGARGIVLWRCEIAHVGRSAVWFRRGCTTCSVENSYLHDLGASGVRVGEAKIADHANSQTSRVKVEGNVIHGAGLVHPDSEGVWIGQCGDSLIAHNDISGQSGSAISAGRGWVGERSLALRNTIELNRIHHIGRGSRSGVSAVQLEGPSHGTVVRNNVIHDVYGPTHQGPGGWGITNGEGTVGVVTERNLVYRVHEGGYHQDLGAGNVVRMNIFALSNNAPISLGRASAKLNFTFERNLVYWNGPSPLINSPHQDAWSNAAIQMGNNIFWNASGGQYVFDGIPLADWTQSDALTGSIEGDPRFYDAESGDFRLQPDSAAAHIEFEPLEYSQAGVQRNSALRDLVNTFSYPPKTTTPPPNVVP